MKTYRVLYRAFLDSQRRIVVTESSPQEIFALAQLVLNDHPELFWVWNKFSITSQRKNGETACTIAPTYLHYNLSKTKSEIMNAASGIIASIPNDADEYTIVKTLYDTIATTITYDHAEAQRNLPANSNAYCLVGGLVDHLAVCDGYSAAMQFLLQRLGIMAYKLTGTAHSSSEDGPHAWLLVRIEGSFYHVDPTWGSTSAMAETPCPLEANYDYLLVTDRDIRKTHRLNSSIPIPACSAREANFYKREHLLLGCWTEDMFANLLVKQLKRNQHTVAVRATKPDVYLEMCSCCRDSTRLGRALNRSGLLLKYHGYTYSTNQQLLTLRITFDF